MFDGVARWWDGFELWLAQLWFPFQFVLVIAVLLPLCAAVAWVIQHGVDAVADRVSKLGGPITGADCGADVERVDRDTDRGSREA